VISDDAYRAGYFSTHIGQTDAPQSLPTNPVVRFELVAYGDRLIFDRQRVRGFYEFDISIVGDALAGDIHVNDLSTDTVLSGVPASSWSVKAHHSDRPGSCFQLGNTCSGVTGAWVLVSVPAPNVVPNVLPNVAP
jgi:hypothetical protein